MKKSNRRIKISYEPEADVLRIESGRQPIDYATEFGNVIVHFNRNDQPVYFEILEATRFIKKASELLRPPARRALTALR